MPKYKVSAIAKFEFEVIAPDEDHAAEASDDLDYEDMKQVGWEVTDVKELP